MITYKKGIFRGCKLLQHIHNKQFGICGFRLSDFTKLL